MVGFPLLTILGLFELNVTKFYSSLVNLFQRPSNNMVKSIDLLLGFNFFCTSCFPLCYDKKQLKERSVYVVSQFTGLVHHCEKVTHYGRH